MEHYVQTVLSVILMSLINALIYAQIDNWTRTEGKTKTRTAMLVFLSVGITTTLGVVAVFVSIEALHLLVLNGTGG